MVQEGQYGIARPEHHESIVGLAEAPDTPAFRLFQPQLLAKTRFLLQVGSPATIYNKRVSIQPDGGTTLLRQVLPQQGQASEIRQYRSPALQLLPQGTGDSFEQCVVQELVFKPLGGTPVPDRIQAQTQPITAWMRGGLKYLDHSTQGRLTGPYPDCPAPQPGTVG